LITGFLGRGQVNQPSVYFYEPLGRFAMHEQINRYVSIFVTISAVILSVVSLYTSFFGIFETIV
ncbi:unnamed protein product, partial [marine sediment metagenome]